MNLIRNVLSHSVLLIIVAFAAYIYLYRSDILPEWFPPAANNTVTATTAATAGNYVSPGPDYTAAPAYKEGEEALLHAARAAFWSKNIELAEMKYRALLETSAKDSADVHGELGNVYYMAGRWKEAGAAYYEAAIRLLQRGERDRAHYLYKVISGLDAEQAKPLATQLGIPDQG